MIKLRTRRRSPIAWIGGALLNLLAVLGLVCIVLVIVGIVSNVSIMMFRTGSMSPTITAGSIAFVKEIPAEEMTIGDVVTVDRGPDVLPVTHRVITILDTDEQSGRVTFEMRGDANEAKDPEPYTAQTVRRVMFSVPGLAPIIQEFRNPYVLGGITIGASLLVVWAFWPRREDDENDEGPIGDEYDPGALRGVSSAEVNSHSAESRGSGAEPEDSGIAAKNPNVEASAAWLSSSQTSPRSPKHAVALPAVAVLLAASGGAVPVGAAATDASRGTTQATTVTEAHGEFLHLRAVGDNAEMLGLTPGSSANWTVDIWADTPDPGRVSVEIGSGRITLPLAEELLVDVRSCAQLVSMDECPGGATRPITRVPLSELGAAPEHDRAILEMPSDEQRRVQVTVFMKTGTDAQAVAGQTSGVRMTAIGQGEEVSIGPGDPGPGDPGLDGPGPGNPGPGEPGPSGELPWTGVDGWQWLLLAAVLLIGTGSALVARARRREAS